MCGFSGVHFVFALFELRRYECVKSPPPLLHRPPSFRNMIFIRHLFKQRPPVSALVVCLIRGGVFGGGERWKAVPVFSALSPVDVFLKRRFSGLARRFHGRFKLTPKDVLLPLLGFGQSSCVCVCVSVCACVGFCFFFCREFFRIFFFFPQ